MAAPEQTRTDEDSQGQPRYITEVIAADVQFIGGRDGTDGSGPVAVPMLVPDSNGELGHGVRAGDDDVPF